MNFWYECSLPQSPLDNMALNGRAAPSIIMHSGGIICIVDDDEADSVPLLNELTAKGKLFKLNTKNGSLWKLKNR